MGREERTGGARDSTALQPPGQQDLLVSCIAEEVGAAKAASYAAGYADGWMAYANAIQPGLQQMAQAILAFGSNKYEMLRNLLATGTSTKGAEALKATRPPPPPWCRTLKVSTLPPLEESRATEAAAVSQSRLQHSYGHRLENAPASLKQHVQGAGMPGAPQCNSKACCYQAAARCPHGLCALHCDKRWAAHGPQGADACLTQQCEVPLPRGDQASARSVHDCPHHQRNGQPQTLGALMFDEYTAQVDDPCAWLRGWLNEGEGAAMLKAGLAKEVTVDGVCWVDGGRSCGQDVTEWCMVLTDDAGQVFSGTVAQLTACTFHRFITTKDKCNMAGLTRVVGPLCRSLVDLGLYGAVHEASGTRVKVLIKQVVADMDALICLCGKALQSPAHCPWCTASLRNKKDRAHEGPWGELTSQHEWVDTDKPYGYWMYRWIEDVLPRRWDRKPESQWKARDGTSTWRKDTGGVGKERPVLFRYRKVISTNQSKWAYGAAAVPLREGSLYRTPRQDEEPEAWNKGGWDEVVATAEEHAWYIRHNALSVAFVREHLAFVCACICVCLVCVD
jgi:hypothetical protein